MASDSVKWLTHSQSSLSPLSILGCSQSPVFPYYHRDQSLCFAGGHLRWVSSRYETKMAARTGKSSILTILRKNRNLCTVYINIREFKQRQPQRNDKKPNRLILAKQQLCTCIALCTFRSRRCTNTRWKCLNKFHVLSRTEHKTTTFLFFSWTLIQSFRIQLKNILPTFDELNMMYGIRAIKFKAARNHFLRIVFVNSRRRWC